MSEGFWSLRNAPSWWFDRRAWRTFAIVAIVMLAGRWAYGPGQVPQGKVVFYGAEWCGYTQALTQYLTESGIPFERRDIDTSTGNLVRYFFASGKRRGGGLPVVQVGPEVVAKGFYREDIDRALIAAGYRPSGRAPGADGFSERR